MTEVFPSRNIDRIAPTRKPEGAPIGSQSWRDLLFLHWRISEEELRPLIPNQLSIDTFDGTAWIGLVPFAMRNVRPWWFCSVPGISNFLETNVRTYVHREGTDPGVWFFSLEASNSLAVRIARSIWKLPYFKAAMTLYKDDNGIRYQSDRHWPTPKPARTDVSFCFQETSAKREFRAAEPETFEHFLVERYYLYAADSFTNLDAAKLYRGQVHHAPYQFCEVDLVECQQNLVSAAGLSLSGSPEHCAYSPGVDVGIYPLIPLD